MRAELEARLAAAKIDVNDTHVWTRRGRPTRIESRRRSTGVGKPRWSRGAVRDIEVSLIDAISDASWLRSKVSTHRFSDSVRSLTVYDVYNVQSLARRLGAWPFGHLAKFALGNSEENSFGGRPRRMSPKPRGDVHQVSAIIRATSVNSGDTHSISSGEIIAFQRSTSAAWYLSSSVRSNIPGLQIAN